MDRLQKVIAESGFTSRRKAEELIVSGKVKVNGEVVTKLGTKVSKNDTVTINGTKLEQQGKEYYLFYKPRGVICSTSDDKGRKTVIDYFNNNTRLYPVGRLDYDASGILIITNDGDFANLIMHPKNEIEKTYIVKLEGIIDGLAIKKLKSGIRIDNQICYPSKVKLRKKDLKTKTSIVEIIIHEGKNHQVKKMFDKVGYKVLKLKREVIGFLTLKGLNVGEYRRITPHEIKKIYLLAQKKD